MRITVLTLFPEMYQDFLSASIIGRAVERKLVSVDFVQIRDFAHDHYKHVDDRPFGGGMGQVMKCQPVLEGLESVRDEDSWTIMMNPAGQPYSQKKAHELSQKKHLIILCGHYEGMDSRIENHCDELLSIGDYVLTGGEIASMVVMDSVIRLLKGSISEGSTDEESFENGLLEYPQYTQPADYNGEKVPDILLSGNHQKIREWRIEQSILRTRAVRPDLLEKHIFTKEERKIFDRLDKEGKL